ncbi:PAS domain S-box-containing protein/diguanylate cyclase (GGDEF) domain-containing protein [Halopseudomonas aestusnigri]|uniref:cyclic-guanylate-specific phosphodiesterase n=2 Tax=Halopseudomonas aestusnigri TaxID=857252 RepID=A0AAQ1G989_9GAMM|nr:PAS domain S-box-containing protein/diguanylate cyclase (GGDEF) domain-containing protein [Halopseudomonas aestusnigri]
MHPGGDPKWRFAMLACLVSAALMVVALSLPRIPLFVERPQDYVSLHLLLELVAVVVSVMVVAIAWGSLGKRDLPRANVLIFGFSLVAASDLAHALAYEGMPSLIVDGSVELSIFFWLAGRFIEALSLLLVAAGVRFHGTPLRWLAAALLLFAGLLLTGVYALHLLPDTFVPGQGVTAFKARIEYALCAANLVLSGWLFTRFRRERNVRFLWLGLASFVMGVGELAFTGYVDPSDAISLLGHFYKVLAYIFIYRAAFIVAVHEPYRLLSRTTELAQAREQDLNRLMQNLPVGVVRLDPSLAIRFCNPAFERTFLSDAAAETGRPFERAINADLFGQLLPLLRNALRGERGQLDGAYCAPQGELRHGHAIVVPDGDGVMAIFTDTTERERNLQKLELSMRENSDIRLALDAHAIVAFTDARGVITKVNDKFCAISQYARDELIGRTHSLLNSRTHPREFFDDLWRTITHGEVWNGEVCNRAKDGSLYWVQTTIVPFVGDNGLPEQYIAIRADITKRKQAEAQALHIALHDELTGLPNRRLMTERLLQATRKAVRSGSYGAVLMIDLDNFKEINDTLGHAQGDALLCQVAGRLQQVVRDVDTVTRLGGDEFVLLFEDLGSDLDQVIARVAARAEHIRQRLGEPYQLSSLQLGVSPSIGVTLFSLIDDQPEELVKQADMAMYRAKDAGRDQVCFFDPAMQTEVVARAMLLRDLRQALENHEFCLFYQPVVDGQQRILGVEALIRWQHPQRGMVSPATFIPLAEDSGLILPIGQWVLETACRQLVSWAQDPERAHWHIAVNVSARQLNQVEFVDQVTAVIDATGAPAARLRMELTESMLQDNLPRTIGKMRTLRQMGIRFSLDDFGTGYSSLSYLKRLPLDQLKIDKSFIDHILTDANDAAIAGTIVALGRTLGLGVVAEGVETVEQMRFLVDSGCEVFQGYLFGRPVEAAALGRSRESLATS